VVGLLRQIVVVDVRVHFGHLIIVSYIPKPINVVRKKEHSKLIEIIKKIQQKGFRL
jgi:hypothetical protein